MGHNALANMEYANPMVIYNDQVVLECIRISYMSSLRILGESPDFAPRLPPCAISPGRRRNLRISPDFSVISLKSNKIIQFWLGPSQLIGTELLKMTTDDGLGNYHKQ